MEYTKETFATELIRLFPFGSTTSHYDVASSEAKEKAPLGEDIVYSHVKA